MNELAVIVNLSPILHFHRRLINASLPQFTSQGVTESRFELFEVEFVCLLLGAAMARIPVSLRTMLSKNESILVEFTSLIVAVFEGISVECTSPISSLSVTQFTVETLI